MKNDTLVIRDGRFEDIDCLVDLLEQLFAMEEDFTFDAEKQRKGLALMLDGCGKHRAVKVALHGNSIVGMCTVQTRISTSRGSLTGILEDLIVTADHRGRGAGKRLLKEISQWARKRGIGHLQLLADKNNTQALTFYNLQGWQRTNLACLTLDL
ncbi:MAG: GNAT family N-acetyltransferase [Desulfobacteraceae bacterium]|nr:GNAT family N-acetyltransferase [Desulfobacteraceae bacterium]